MGVNENCGERAVKRLKLEVGNPSLSDPDKNRPSPSNIEALGRAEMKEDHSVSNGTPGSSNGKDSSVRWILETETIGSRDQIRKVEFIRLITQALQSLGYSNSASLLQTESQVQLQPTAVTYFRDGILKGEWDRCIESLSEMPLDMHENQGAKFLILQQKFLELLELGQTNLALHVLRSQIAPLSVNMKKVHRLAGLVICLTNEELRIKAKWGGAAGDSRHKLLVDLQNLFPPSIMIPENRLLKLVEDALDSQRQKCVFHNSYDTIYSLFVEHRCGKNQIPTKTTQVLEDHKDEVWFLQFSHDGTRLASASKDKTVIIWEVGAGTNARVQYTLSGHSEPLSFLAWSPDDARLLTCGSDCTVRLWDTQSGACIRIFSKHTKTVTACAWLPDGQRFLSGGMDKCAFLWDTEGRLIRSWEGEDSPRINDLAVTADGQYMVSICNEKEIRVVHLSTGAVHVIAESHSVTSLASSASSHSWLVNLSNGVIHQWDNLQGSPPPSTAASQYTGQVQGRFVIRSCFGGSEEAFIASGSEDSQVYIWHRGTGDLLEVLQGHSGTVNAVSWNPRNPHMFASASDDKTVRLWGVPFQEDGFPGLRKGGSGVLSQTRGFFDKESNESLRSLFFEADEG